MEENVLELSHICKYFPGIKANDDISLTLRKGEIHALLGENGAGKSTLMSMVSGLYKPTSGDIILNGEKVTLLGTKVNGDDDIVINGVHLKREDYVYFL